MSMGAGPRLQKFHAPGPDGLELYAISPADAAAEAFANRDNQVYFGKGAITLRAGMRRHSPTHSPTPQQSSEAMLACCLMSFS